MAYSQHHPPHPALCTVRTLLRALTAASLCNLCTLLHAPCGRPVQPVPCSVLHAPCSVACLVWQPCTSQGHTHTVHVEAYPYRHASSVLLECSLIRVWHR